MRPTPSSKCRKEGSALRNVVFLILGVFSFFILTTGRSDTSTPSPCAEPLFVEGITLSTNSQKYGFLEYLNDDAPRIHYYLTQFVYTVKSSLVVASNYQDGYSTDSLPCRYWEYWEGTNYSIESYVYKATNRESSTVEGVFTNVPSGFYVAGVNFFL